MQTLKHSIISLVSVPKSLRSLDLKSGSLEELAGFSVHCDALVAPLEILFEKPFPVLWSGIRENNRGAQLIVVADPSASMNLLLDTHRRFPVFRLFESLEESGFEWALFEAVERSNWIQQNEQLQILVRDQFERLKNLYTELEDRVGKRQRYLEESRRKNLIAQFRWNTLRRATESIHEARSVPEMERALAAVLQESLNLLQIRLVLPHQNSIAQSEKPPKDFSVHRVKLFQEEDVAIGYALFIRDKSWPFSTEEKDFLQKISEALSLAIRRLNQLEISGSLREQWQATFNAVSDPMALVNRHYDIIQSNSAFTAKAQASGGRMKCYQLLFHRDIPCAHCRLGEDFRIHFYKGRGEGKQETWDVHSQVHQLSSEEEPLYFNRYQDVTEQLRLEQRLLEGARLAELGIIGSSIAHELNNPLGGILSFVQMMKMDLAPDDPLYPDLLEMENGVLRCRDIVQNLLGFTRQSGSDDLTVFDFREALQRALSLIDLQTRAHGLEVRRRIPEQPVPVYGHLNLLSQAIANLLQDSVQSVRQNAAKVPPHIEIIAWPENGQLEVQVLDNGPGQEVTPRISIPLAQQIVMDHRGQFEVSQPSKGLRLVRFTLPLHQDQSVG